MHKQHLYMARGTTLDSAHGDIQLMPPGQHEISPTATDGKPVTLNVTINAATAEALEKARAFYQAEADAGKGDAPYIDFNHADGPAAAWVKEIFWAGDAADQGVRARIEWSDAGREAIEGRAFRRFSPSFLVNAENGEIIGAPVNMGGLVNRAAFRSIQSFFASLPPLNPQPSTKPMTPEEIKALQTENEDLRNQLAALKKQLDLDAKERAEETVEAAAKEGRIAPDAAIKAKWVTMLLADKANAATLLASLPKLDALNGKSIIQAKSATADRDTLRAELAALPRADRPAFFAKHREALI